MPNHYHILLKTNGSNLSKSMQWVGATYTRRYNICHKRTAHLFQGQLSIHPQYVSGQKAEAYRKNEEIWNAMGISYSGVSKSVFAIKKQIQKDNRLKKVQIVLFTIQDVTPLTQTIQYRLLQAPSDF